MRFAGVPRRRARRCVAPGQPLAGGGGGRGTLSGSPPLRGPPPRLGVATACTCRERGLRPPGSRGGAAWPGPTAWAPACCADAADALRSRAAAKKMECAKKVGCPAPARRAVGCGRRLPSGLPWRPRNSVSGYGNWGFTSLGGSLTFPFAMENSEPLLLGTEKASERSAFTLQSHRPHALYYTMRSAPMSARLSSRQHVGALRPAARAGSATSRPRIVAVRAEKVVGIDLGTTNSAVRARRPAVVPCAAPPPFLVLAAPSARSPGAAPGAGCCYGGRQAYHCEQRRGRAHHP